jgi:hypothetical protein
MGTGLGAGARRRAVLLVALAIAVAVVAMHRFGAAQPPRAPATASASASSHPPPAPAPVSTGAEAVTVGVYVNQIHELSLKENFFVVDAYVWFRWSNDEYKPYETFSLIDGRIESKREVVRKTLPDGTLYAYVRVVAKITSFWDISAFPLDNHGLTIVVEEEDSEDHVLFYRADRQNSGADPNIRLPGWQLDQATVVAGTGIYKSNFGDASLPTGNESRYSNVEFSLSFNRRGWTYFFKLFFGLWVAAAIAFLSFFIKPTNVDPRFGLGVGALFAAIASEYVVTSSLPDTNVITLADSLHLAAFAAIFLAVAQSTWSLHMCEHGHEARAKLFDRACAALFPMVYIAINAWLVSRR